MSEGEQLKVYSMEEVEKHNTAESLWLVIHDKVYDVTTFMEEHPGGEEVMLEVGGRDSTESFEDVGHSPDAREQQAKYLIGRVATQTKKKVEKNTTPTAKDPSSTSFFMPILILVAVAVAIIYLWL